MALRFTGGGKYGTFQKKARYRGHIVWQDIGFAGTKSYKIDNNFYPKFNKPSEAKKHIDEMEGKLSNGRERKAIFYRFSGGGGTYQSLSVAKQDAQQHANATGQTVTIQSAKGGGAWKGYSTVKPKTLPNGKWTKAKAVRIVHRGGRKVLEVRT